MPAAVSLRTQFLAVAVGGGLPGCSDPATTSQTALAGTTLPQPRTAEVTTDGRPADSPNGVAGQVSCVGLPGTSQESWQYDGRFAMTS